jgi:hypothetical protein
MRLQRSKHKAATAMRLMQEVPPYPHPAKFIFA